MPRRGTVIPYGLYDFVDCNLFPVDFQILSMEQGSRIRVQNYNIAFQIDDKGVITNISPFF